MKYILLISSILWLAACKKEPNISGAIPNTNIVGADFIEFKIDGTSYRLEERPYSPGDKLYTNSTIVINNAPAIPLYQILFTFNMGLASQAISFRLASSEPFQVKKYQYATFDAFNHPTFIYLTSLNSGYQTDLSKLATGSVEITKLDTLKGGAIEGIFNLNTVEKYIETNGVDKVLSTHSLTEGKFKVTFKK